MNERSERVPAAVRAPASRMPAGARGRSPRKEAG